MSEKLQHLDSRYEGRWRLVYRMRHGGKLSRRTIEIWARHIATGRQVVIPFTDLRDARHVFDTMTEKDLDESAAVAWADEQRGQA